MTINHQFIKETVRANYLMQLGTYISELSDLSGVRLSYTHHFSSIWYNNAYDIEIEASEIDELIRTVETYMLSRNRTPCIYVSPATKPSNLGILLLERGYQKVEAEAWMFCDFSQQPKPYICPTNIMILNVQTNADFEIFADIYRRGYPSSRVDLQIQACIDGFNYKPAMVDVQYFVASYDGKPAGMASFFILGEYACIYAVVTLNEFKRKGICRSLMHYIRSIAEQKEVKYLFLQTIVGGDGETVYQKFGYSTLYVRECYMPADTGYGEFEGHTKLREALASHYSQQPTVDITAEEIFIRSKKGSVPNTTSSQHITI